MLNKKDKKAKARNERDLLSAARPLRSMTDKDRRRYIYDLEDARCETIREIEEIMQKASYATKKKAMRRRKFKLGKSPNDWVAK